MEEDVVCLDGMGVEQSKVGWNGLKTERKPNPYAYIRVEEFTVSLSQHSI